MEKVIITAALTGSRPTKAMNPAVPYTPEEIAASAVKCYAAGAAIAHIHVRDPATGEPSSALELFQQVVTLIREKCDLLLNLTTSGLHIEGSDAEERRLLPITLRPELCSLDIGSLNMKDRVFSNHPDWGRMAAKKMGTFGVKPEIEIFDVGHIAPALSLIEEGYIDDPPYFQLCMGVGWGIPASAENMLFLKNKLPSNAIWSVLGVGKSQLPMITMGILLGGHVRVGFEDNIFLRKGVPAKSNAEFVQQAAGLVRTLQREVATVNDARQLLGLANSSASLDDSGSQA